MDQNFRGSVPTETDYQREVDETLKWYQEIASRNCQEGGARRKGNLVPTSTEGGQKF